MANFPILFFVENHLVGVGKRGYETTKGELHVPFSYVYFCPNCGEPWARIVCDDPNTRWIHYRRKCPKHGPPFLLAFGDEEFNEAAPLSVWVREFKLAMQWLEMGGNYRTYQITGGL